MKACLVLLSSAAILCATPRWFFPICGVVAMNCHRTLVAETWLAAALAAVAGLCLVWRPVAHLLLPIAVLVALFPLSITGVCPGRNSPCHLGTQPALIVLAVLLLCVYAAMLIGSANARSRLLAERH